MVTKQKWRTNTIATVCICQLQCLTNSFTIQTDSQTQQLVIACCSTAATESVCATGTASWSLLALFTVPCHQLRLKPLVVIVNVLLQVRQQPNIRIQTLIVLITCTSSNSVSQHTPVWHAAGKTKSITMTTTTNHTLWPLSWTTQVSLYRCTFDWNKTTPALIILSQWHSLWRAIVHNGVSGSAGHSIPLLKSRKGRRNYKLGMNTEYSSLHT